MPLRPTHQSEGERRHSLRYRRSTCLTWCFLPPDPRGAGANDFADVSMILILSVSSVEQYTGFSNNVNNTVYLTLIYYTSLSNYILNYIVISFLEFVFVKNIDYI